MYNLKKIFISGFSDEISSNFDEQLKVVRSYDLNYISIRTVDEKNIGDYSLEEVKEKIIPRLHKANVKVSSIGSPIGKVDIDDEEGFKKQLVQLETLCQIANLLQCRYMRVFSFFVKEGEFAAKRDAVIAKMKQFVKIAEQYKVIMIHENEKDIYGDIATRCLDLYESINSPSLKHAFDFANFVQCGENTFDCYNLLKKHIAYIHIKDAIVSDKENVLCGTGEGNIPAILKTAILKDGYTGFLTLEPHLVLFDGLGALEKEAATDIIKENKAKDGAEGYKMQLDALVNILNSF